MVRRRSSPRLGRRRVSTISATGRAGRTSGDRAEGRAKARTDQWIERTATYGALDALKRSWSGELPTNAADLRLQVGQFEDVVRAVTASSGFGNLVLADTARRLDLVLLSHYAVMHPSEHAIVCRYSK